MKAARVLSSSVVSLMLCMIAACGAGQSGTASPPGLLKVPTSSWRPGDPSLTALARGTLRV